MKDYVKRIRIVVVTVLLVMLVTIYITVYTPLESNLKELTLGNIHMSSHHKMLILENAIEKGIVGAKGITSRS